MSLRCAAVRPDPASSWSSFDRAAPWKSAPIAATPSVPPTIRLIDRMPGGDPGLGVGDGVHRRGGHRRHRQRDADAHQDERRAAGRA